MAKHELWELQSMQAAPLDVKLKLTKRRIQDWVNEFGKDGVYISFSGGKDSTVLMDIIRNDMGLNIPAVFVDVPTQYPELREFVKKWDNVEILKPKMSFIQVCEKYGFPLISKEVSECVYEARKYLTTVKTNESVLTDRQTDRQTVSGYWAFADIASIPRRQGAQNSEVYKDLKKGIIPEGSKFKYGKPVRILQLEGKLPHKEKGVITEEYSKQYDKSRYAFYLDAPFEISHMCCKAMKKSPLKEYSRRTGRNPITAQMAEESMLRQSQWIKFGCNMYEAKNPISNPMSFWLENDVLEYIKIRNIEICSVYGDIVEDFGDLPDGQMHLADYGLAEKQTKYKCTGCKRTGCMLCGFGAHLEKSPNRFEMLKETHPKMYDLLDVVKNNGITFREAIEWTNEHGNMNIKL